MLSKRAVILLSLCVLGGTLVSASGNHMVLVDTGDEPTVPQTERATIDATPSEVDFRTDIPDFIPTPEWQEVMDGQAVPAGLDIRFDFAKGKKYAKLLDGETAPPDYSRGPKITKRLPAERPASDLPVSMEDAVANILAEDNARAFQAPVPVGNLTDSLKNMLLELPEPDPDIADAISRKLSDEQMEEIYKKVWQKRQQEIADVYAQIRDEASVMKKLLRVVLERKGRPSRADAAGPDAANAEVTAEGTVDPEPLPTTDELIEIFEELQKSVEDLDTARDFNTIGGFAIMADVLADRGDDYSGRAPPVDAGVPTFDKNAIKAHAAWVMGTAIKNQHHLQTAALRSSIMDPLISLAKDIDSNPRGAAKGMYALGALLRHHEEAQTYFVGVNGVEALLDVLEAAYFGPSTSRQILRRRHTVGTKIIALIEDLIVDSHSAQLLEQLVGARCCNQLARVLSKCQTNNEFEKAFRALDAASTRCAQHWAAGAARTQGIGALQRQIQEWQTELREEGDDDYLVDLIRQAENIIRVMYP